LTNDNGNQEVHVEQLFATDQDPVEPIIPPRPLITNSGGQTIESGKGYRDSTFAVSLTVDEDNSAVTAGPSYLVLAIALLATLLMFRR
jgi:hypothetical protein